MQATFQTKIRDERVYPLLDAQAALFGRLMRRLFVDLYVRGHKVSKCKRLYIARYGITARFFNAIACELKGNVRAVERARKRRMEMLRDQIAATEKAIRRLQKQDRALASGKGKAAEWRLHERAERRRRVRFRLHQKKRRLSVLRARLEAEQVHQGPPSICFGSRKLFRAQFHLAENGFASHANWLRAWREARSGSFFCLGSKDETGGNQTCTLFPDGTLRLRVPGALAPQWGTHVWLTGIRFPYGREVIDAALSAGRAISYRFVRRERRGKAVWYVHATVDRPPAPLVSRRDRGAIGADLNSDVVAAARVDRYGNVLHVRHWPLDLEGKSQDQITAALAEVVADIISWAESEGVPVVVEHLDFERKKAALRETGGPQLRRKLSGFVYGKFHDLLLSRAAREGVEVTEADPKYTTAIGFGKFAGGYHLSVHAAAAVAIARRGLGFGERLCARLCPGRVAGSALPLPVRNRGRHVLDDWSRYARRLHAARQKAVRGRRLFRRGWMRGIPLSTAAPLPRRAGPPCDGSPSPAPGR